MHTLGAKCVFEWMNRSIWNFQKPKPRLDSAVHWEGYSLIKEGKEVSHDNQSGFGQDQEDFPDMQSSLL